MKSRMVFFIGFLLISLSGCFWPFHGGAKTAAGREVYAPVSFQVLNEAAFQREGGIAFVPFVAGPDAEAGADVDRLALIMVKVTADVLTDLSSMMTVVTDQDIGAAQYVLDGRIETLNASHGYLWWHKKGVLKIRAEVRRHDTGEVVAVISGEKRFKRLREADQAAVEIGREIAEGLVR